jgi:putative transcriptional regulator
VNAEFLSAIFELRELLLELIGMAVSYKKLWKLLIDKDMKKKDLCAAAGISHASMAKLGKSENVTTDVLVKICTALQCDIGDIMELTQDPIK